MLPILHGVQDTLGYVPPETIPLIAQELNLSRAEVHGVASFYHYFRDTPPGRHVLYLCRAEACQSMGARALEEYAKKQLGIEFHETTVDGCFSLEPVYCLGNCACAPALMIDQELHGRVNKQTFDDLIQSMKASS